MSKIQQLLYPIKIFKFFCIVFVFICYISVAQWSKIPYTNTSVNLTLAYVCLIFLFALHFSFKQNISKTDHILISVYVIWVLFNIIRGALFETHDYWQWKSLVGSIPVYLFVFCVYLFSSPYFLSKILQKWVRFVLPVFCIFFFIISPGARGYYLAPILLLILFYRDLSIKWRIIILVLACICAFSDLSARSNLIKFLLSILLGFSLYFHRIINFKSIFRHWGVILLISPFILLFLGITGIFNIFRMEDYIHASVKIEKMGKDGQMMEENLYEDSRTFIYSEVITSAINHNYWLWGRTPARGNDTSFALVTNEDINYRKIVVERHANEVGAANVFTHHGLIGLIIYIFFYLRAAYLGLFKSKSLFLKVIGFVVCFRFFYFWVEDYFSMNIQTLSLWMMISICLSKRFRSLDDRKMAKWANSIFK